MPGLRSPNRHRLLESITVLLVATAVLLGVAVARREAGAGTTAPEARSRAALPSTRAPGSPVTRCEELVGYVSGKQQWDEPPAMQIDPAIGYQATLQTSKGTIVIALDAAAAPVTVNNFVFLARCGFYDGVTFHRVARNFVIQGGDPKGNGRGGPGYTFRDELPPTPGYAVGAVAMANAGPNTNGSQFFIVIGSGASRLPNSYSLFGQVTEGLDVAQGIGQLPLQGGSSDGPPEETVTITSVTVTPEP